jgi:hypothetical protein
MDDVMQMSDYQIIGIYLRDRSEERGEQQGSYSGPSMLELFKKKGRLLGKTNTQIREQWMKSFPDRATEWVDDASE